MRTIPTLKNTAYLSSTIETKINVEDAFRFLIEDLSIYYSQLSQGHEHFTIMDGDHLTVGAKIECSEKAGNQWIEHLYIVHEIIENERIHYVSNPSRAKIKLPWAVIDTTSNTYVYYDLTKGNKGSTLIRLTIGIQFKHLFEKVFSQLFLGLLPWKRHCVEEMNGLKKLLDDRALTSPS